MRSKDFVIFLKLEYLYRLFTYNIQVMLFKNIRIGNFL